MGFRGLALGEYGRSIGYPPTHNDKNILSKNCSVVFKYC